MTVERLVELLQQIDRMTKQRMQTEPNYTLTLELQTDGSGQVTLLLDGDEGPVWNWVRRWNSIDEIETNFQKRIEELD